MSEYRKFLLEQGFVFKGAVAGFDIFERHEVPDNLIQTVTIRSGFEPQNNSTTAPEPTPAAPESSPEPDVVPDPEPPSPKDE